MTERHGESTMSEQPQPDRATQAGDGGAGDVLGKMISDFGETVRREIEQVRADLAERAAGGAKGAGLLAAAGAAGAVALVATASLPIMALRRVMPGWAIALGFAGGAGALAAVLARRGLAELGAAAPVDADRIKNAARDAVRSIA
jgi:Putative Actinobacterial Holin-X, holin superfamily III